MGCSNSNVEEPKIHEKTKINNPTKTKSEKLKIKKYLKISNDKKWTYILSYLSYKEIYISGKANKQINKIAVAFLKNKLKYEKLEKKENGPEKKFSNSKKVMMSDNEEQKVKEISSFQMKKALMSSKRISILDVLEKNFEKTSKKSSTKQTPLLKNKSNSAENENEPKHKVSSFHIDHKNAKVSERINEEDDD